LWEQSQGSCVLTDTPEAAEKRQRMEVHYQCHKLVTLTTLFAFTQARLFLIQGCVP